MLTAVENCARMPPFALLVEPCPAAGSCSISTTSRTPSRARCHAMLQPVTPAPTMTTSAVLFMASRREAGGGGAARRTRSGPAQVGLAVVAAGGGEIVRLE